MKCYILLSGIICLVIGSGYAQCVLDTNAIYSFTYNGKNYEIIKENQSWINAAACAVERGGYLAEINSQEEEDTLFYHVNNAGITASNTVAPDGGGASYLWIGGNDLAVEGEWIWDGNNDGSGPQFWQGTSSGSPVGGLYNNWGNEPDDWSGQDALGFAFTDWPLGVAGQWNDVDETNTLYYVIEYPDNSGLHENEGSEIQIFPNPAENDITICFKSEFLDARSVEIYSESGELIATHILTSSTIKVDVSAYESGIYYLRLDDRVTKEFVISR